MNMTLTTTRPRLRWLASGLAMGMLAAAIAGPGVGAADPRWRQPQTKTSATFDPRINVLNLAPVLAHDLCADRQTQTGSPHSLV